MRIFVQRFFLCGYFYKRSRFVKTVEGKNIGASLKHVYLEVSILLFYVYQKYVNWMLLIIVVFTCTRSSIGEGGGICFLNCEKRFMPYSNVRRFLKQNTLKCLGNCLSTPRKTKPKQNAHLMHFFG